MIRLEDRIADSIRFIKEHVAETPSIGLILGSGLGDYADNLSNSVSISTQSIPNYPVSTVEGHKGRLVFFAHSGKKIVTFQGRVHFYESDDSESVLFPIYVAHQLGVQRLIITNAAGGINRTFSPGDLMVIFNQIDLTSIALPRIGKVKRRRETLYDTELIPQILEIGQRNDISLRRGVYAGLKGPSYETAAEIEMIRRLGADAVGMSTVLEVSLAASLGMRVIGISCISNLATGITNRKLSHAEVTEVGNKTKDRFARLIGMIIESL